MTNYREILRLYSQGISQRGIASSCQCSRNTVSAVIKRADEIGIYWPFEKEISNENRTLPNKFERVKDRSEINAI